MPTTFCVSTRDNRWISQKLSVEKNTIGNEPYIKKATVLGSFFVLIDVTLIISVNAYIHWRVFLPLLNLFYLFCPFEISVIRQLKLYRFHNFFPGFIIQLIKRSEQIIHIRHTVFPEKIHKRIHGIL